MLLSRQERVCARHANRRHQSRPKHFVFGVVPRAEVVGAVEEIISGPGLGLPTRQHEQLRWPFLCERHPRIDPTHERRPDRSRIRTVARPLGIEIAAILHPPGHEVARHEIRSQHFGQASLARAAPQVHLEQTVLRLDKALREEEIVAIAGVNVRHARAIADDANRGREAGHGERAGYLSDQGW